MPTPTAGRVLPEMAAFPTDNVTFARSPEYVALVRKRFQVRTTIATRATHSEIGKYDIVEPHY
jgi:hypothetical protein